MLYIKEVEGKGRGVFSDKNIEKMEMIENSPVILMSEKDIISIDKTDLRNYWFNWPKGAAIGLGFLSLYNHSDDANAEFLILNAEKSIVINCVKDISAHEEICINYKNEERFNF